MERGSYRVKCAGAAFAVPHVVAGMGGPCSRARSSSRRGSCSILRRPNRRRAGATEARACHSTAIFTALASLPPAPSKTVTVTVGALSCQPYRRSTRGSSWFRDALFVRICPDDGDEVERVRVGTFEPVGQRGRRYRVIAVTGAADVSPGEGFSSTFRVGRVPVSSRTMGGLLPSLLVEPVPTRATRAIALGVRRPHPHLVGRVGIQSRDRGRGRVAVTVSPTLSVQAVPVLLLILHVVVVIILGPPCSRAGARPPSGSWSIHSVQ